MTKPEGFVDNFFIAERPGTEKPFVVVEKIRKYQRDIKEFETYEQAEAHIKWVKGETP